MKALRRVIKLSIGKADLAELESIARSRIEPSVGVVAGTLIGSQRQAGTALAHAAVPVLQVANVAPLRMRGAFRDVRWRWVLEVLWTAA
jgi:hypothetical protein